ncbi:hypothetical protein FQR65_LT12646 [Abscondita terminalis]|nr:hypothetical protein FQR65_LT12646 [Abscondita terminalis]
MGVGDIINYVFYENPVCKAVLKPLIKSGVSTVQPIIMPPEPVPLWQLASQQAPIIRIAGICGAAAVALGAYGEHKSYPKDRAKELKCIYETGSSFHFLHTLALFGVPMCTYPRVTGGLMLCGTILFCGPCYYHAFTGDDRYGCLAPFGGTVLILAWLSMKQNKKEGFDSLASPFNNVNVDIANIKLGKLWKPLGFTILFSTACFGGAAVWQYENMRSHAITMLKKPAGFFSKRKSEAQYKASEWRLQLNHWWNSLSPGERVFIPICFANILVFAAWKVPRLQMVMLNNFCSNPGSKNVCWPMLLSTFSHYSAIHLFANMYVLHSFSTGAVATLGKEQFLGLYLSAGVISSFTSYVYKTIMKKPGFSLGASGAIMAVLGYICTQYPDTKLGVIFLPFLVFSAGSAIKFIIGLDLAGVVFGWRMFDHAAHLGGAACGIAWSYWGNEYIWHKREPLLQYWHSIRGSIK